MVKKLLIKINDDVVPTQDLQELLKCNENIMKIVTKYKNKITKFHNNKSWDKYKKLSNEYEPIFTSPHASNSYNISNYVPVSRSFFKLWEILHDFSTFFNLNNSANCLFLAEGPGGFAEALIKYRNKMGYTNDNYHGMTLKSFSDKNIPDWKINKEIMKKVKVTFGADDTGNLYNIDNILHIGTFYGLNTFHYITADGGFDFSADFNNQEELSTKLIFCEIFAAVSLQRTGGVFVLKIFDMFNHQTLKIMHILKKFYKELYIIKPLTSRPANSEKYIVCTGYNYDKNLWQKMRVVMEDYSEFQSFCEDIPWDINLLQQLVTYNIHYIIKQVFYIERTIQYINKFEDTTSNLQNILNIHNEKSKKWCLKYNIPFNAV
jgi:23S rRNA U2552 (ribose-2'-O)-methylase RlmE/FtsJ